MEKPDITDVKGIGASTAVKLAENGIDSVKAMATAPLEKLVAVPGFGRDRAVAVQQAAAALLGERDSAAEAPPAEAPPAEAASKKKSKAKKKAEKGKAKKKAEKGKAKKKGKGKKGSKKKK